MSRHRILYLSAEYSVLRIHRMIILESFDIPANPNTHQDITGDGSSKWLIADLCIASISQYTFEHTYSNDPNFPSYISHILLNISINSLTDKTK
jgi:hypothetical protein